MQAIVKKYKIWFVGLGFFLLFLPLALRIDFMQNDDWYYYRTVEDFLKGNFVLHADIAPTLYIQVLLGAVFSLFFSPLRLPVLTLVMSIAGFLAFLSVLKKYFGISFLGSLLISLLLLFNPLYNYGIWGFMTENYFLLFLLLSFYFFHKHLKDSTGHSLIMANVLALAGFFVRQLALVFFLASGFYFFLVKEYKRGFTQLFQFLVIYLFYLTVFPKTGEMLSKGLEFAHLLQFDYSFAISYGSFIYMLAFSIPLVLIFIYRLNFKEKHSLPYYLSLIFLGSVIYFGCKKFFDPGLVSWEEFPYFENIFERKGFYPRSLHGTKYHFKFIHDLYYYWDLVSKILLPVFVATLILNVRRFTRLSTFHFCFLVISLLVLIASPTFFDRYLVLLVPSFLLFLVSFFQSDGVKMPKVFQFGLVALFALFLAFLCYTFALDFVITESFVWNSGHDLVGQGVPANNIYASSAWHEKYGKSAQIDYLFSYDSMEVNPEIKDYFELIDTRVVSYPLNIHLTPKVFLYRRLEK